MRKVKGSCPRCGSSRVGFRADTVALATTTLSLAAYQAGQSAKKEALEKNPDMPKADAEALAKKVQEEYKEKHGYANL